MARPQELRARRDAMDAEAKSQRVALSWQAWGEAHEALADKRLELLKRLEWTPLYFSTLKKLSLIHI